jgi:hypothetical protein
MRGLKTGEVPAEEVAHRNERCQTKLTPFQERAGRTFLPRNGGITAYVRRKFGMPLKQQAGFSIRQGCAGTKAGLREKECAGGRLDNLVLAGPRKGKLCHARHQLFACIGQRKLMKADATSPFGS